MPVHYGGAVKMESLLTLSNLHNTEIIEDAAQSLEYLLEKNMQILSVNLEQYHFTILNLFMQVWWGGATY